MGKGNDGSLLFPRRLRGSASMSYGPTPGMDFISILPACRGDVFVRMEPVIRIDTKHLSVCAFHQGV